jgi:hypothetical protein
MCDKTIGLGWSSGIEQNAAPVCTSDLHDRGDYCYRQYIIFLQYPHEERKWKLRGHLISWRVYICLLIACKAVNEENTTVKDQRDPYCITLAVSCSSFRSTELYNCAILNALVRKTRLRLNIRRYWSLEHKNGPNLPRLVWWSMACQVWGTK